MERGHNEYQTAADVVYSTLDFAPFPARVLDRIDGFVEIVQFHYPTVASAIYAGLRDPVLALMRTRARDVS